MKRGFFLSLAIFLFLTYIILSIAAWTASVEVTEKRMSERFALENAQVVVGGLDPSQVGKVVHTVVYNSMRELSSHTQVPGQTLKATREVQGDDGTGRVNQTVYQLFMGGQAAGDNFDDGRAFRMASDPILTWARQLNLSFQEMGYFLENFSVDDFDFKADSPRTLRYTMTLRIRASSRNGQTAMDKTYRIDDTMDITGLVDPAVYRGGKGADENLNLQKQFFFHETYPTPVQARPAEIYKGKAVAGQGWFYGKTVSVQDASRIIPQDRPTYILAGDYKAIRSLNDPGLKWSDFGAFILTNPIGSAGGACPNTDDEKDTFNPIRYDAQCKPAVDEGDDQTALPFVVLPDFDMNKVGILAPADRNRAGDTSRPAVLFLAADNDNAAHPELKEKGPIGIYNIESLRDFALCSYYTQKEDAPSYLQRLLADGYALRGDTFGIESTVFGTFIGGVAGPGETLPTARYIPDLKSRLDRELFNPNVPITQEELDAIAIRGMPGCKTFQSCSQDSPVGHFRFRREGNNDFGTNDIKCDDGRAVCE